MAADKNMLRIILNGFFHALFRYISSILQLIQFSAKIKKSNYTIIVELDENLHIVHMDYFLPEFCINYDEGTVFISLRAVIE